MLKNVSSLRLCLFGISESDFAVPQKPLLLLAQRPSSNRRPLANLNVFVYAEQPGSPVMVHPHFDFFFFVFCFYAVN